MNLDRINGKLQEKFSINKYELSFAYLIFIGMFAAFVMQQVIGNINQNESEIAEFEEVA